MNDYNGVGSLGFMFTPLTGTLLNEWSGLVGMTSLMMLGTASSGAGVGGTLPADWSGMSSLQQMAMFGNAFTGTLPLEWSALSQLGNIALGTNDLTGTLPSEWSSMTTLTSIQLDSNGFDGEWFAFLLWDSGMKSSSCLPLRGQGRFRMSGRL